MGCLYEAYLENPLLVFCNYRGLLAKPIMGYFGIEWPIILGNMAFQVLLQIDMEADRGPFKSTILYIGASMDFHIWGRVAAAIPNELC